MDSDGDREDDEERQNRLFQASECTGDEMDGPSHEVTCPIAVYALVRIGCSANISPSAVQLA